MELEQAWNLIELLNEDANKKCLDVWKSNNIDEAVRQQATYFKNNLSALDKSQLDAIYYWIDRDAEFCDYFKSLSD